VYKSVSGNAKTSPKPQITGERSAIGELPDMAKGTRFVVPARSVSY